MGEEEKDKAGTYISTIKINLAWKQPTSLRVLEEMTWKSLSSFVSQCLIAEVKFAIHVKMAKEGLQSIYNEYYLIYILFTIA